MGIFDQFQQEAYPFRFEGQLTIGQIMGGTPTDPNVAESWLKAKLLKDGNDGVLQEQVAKVMLERGTGDANEAIEEVNTLKHLNGFRRDAKGLYIEGRQLKAALKEAISVAMGAGKLSARGWGTTNKGLLSFAAEHIFVTEDRLHLGVHQASGIEQRFVHTWRGTGIQYEEYVTNAVINFTVITDWPFSQQDWALIWLTGQMQGLGASRSQSFGRYEVTKWESVGKPIPVKTASKKATTKKKDEENEEADE